MSTLDLNGLIPAIVLPMSPKGDPDEDELRRYVRWVTDQGPVGLAVNVDTGEGPHLTHQEKLRVLEVVKEETHLPCVVGLAGPSTRAAVQSRATWRQPAPTHCWSSPSRRICPHHWTPRSRCGITRRSRRWAYR